MSMEPIQPNHEDYMFLMRGLKELDFDGPPIPSELLLSGDHAFPLAMNSQGQVLIAASLYGRGRIVVLSHEAYLSTFPALVENAVTWLRGDGLNYVSVGAQKYISTVVDNLSFQAEVVEGFDQGLKDGVYVTDAYSVGEDSKDLVAFLKAGGGVLIAGQAWSWAEGNPTENIILNFPGNMVSGVTGIYFSAQHGKVEKLPVSPQVQSSWKAIKVGRDFRDDLEFLLNGIPEFDIPNDATPSEVLVHGPLAFPICSTNDGQPFLAGAYYGRGRVVLVSEEAFPGLETLGSFWNNAIQWLDQSRNGVVGVMPDLDTAFNLFISLGFDCLETNFKNDLSVFVCTAYSEEHMEEIQDFVAEGGGLLIGGQAWWWASTHSGQNLMTDFSGNKILNKMGLSLLEKTTGRGTFKAPVIDQDTKDNNHFCHLLHKVAAHVIQGDELTKYEEESLKKLASDCSSYLKMMAYDWHSYTQVMSVLIDILKRSSLSQMNENNPVTSPTDHFFLSVMTEVYKVCPNPDALLPYLVSENLLLPVVNDQIIRINANTADEEEWISTGLYLSPGMKTYMIIPTEISNKGWKIQIGCQTDYLDADELKRAPSVYDSFPITSETMQVWNLWGGLIYLVAPPKTQVEGVEVIVQTAVAAPYYKSGVTTAADWSVLREAPAPWAELEFENIILTVPSDAVRDLDQPDELAELWDTIMRAVADLAATPHKFSRKERFVADVQISVGWMHAGYPIMVHKVSAVDLVSVTHAKTKGLWGPIHELGHNQQRSCWEFPPHTTECTNNLWSVYVHEEVLGINKAETEVHLTPEMRKGLIEEYVNGGRDFSKWEVFVALETYLELQDMFGWEAFKKVFAAYHEMSNFPDDNKGKMNLYAETFSQTVGMNLCGFFKAWSWPIETSTEEKLSNLPPWIDHPLAEYDSSSH